MIIGNGLLARAFDAEAVAALGATLFASGVSNSNERSELAFERERELLLRHLDAFVGRSFVYFSTTSIGDADRGSTPYARHKRRMEEAVSGHPGHVILRLPQVVGRTSNPHTLTNYFADHIRSGRPFEAWSKARRRIMDVDTVARLTTVLLARPSPAPMVAELVPSEAVSIPELVGMLEQVLGRTACVTWVSRGGQDDADPRLALALAAEVGEDIGAGYTLGTIRKYYG